MRHLGWIVFFGLASTASAKPLLEGDYEVVKFKTPKGAEVDLRQAMLTGDTVWGRTRISFDGDHMTIGATNLELADGAYTACQAEVTFDVQWTKTGFNVPTAVSSKGTVWTFKQLTPNANDNHENHCSVSITKQTFTVKPGDAPVLTSSQGTMYLVRLDEAKIDWSKHVKR